MKATGVTFPGLLGLLFIGLKLGGAINWSWWWVLSPFWLPAAVIFGIAIVMIVTSAVFKR